MILLEFLFFWGVQEIILPRGAVAGLPTRARPPGVGVASGVAAGDAAPAQSGRFRGVRAGPGGRRQAALPSLRPASLCSGKSLLPSTVNKKLDNQKTDSAKPETSQPSPRYAYCPV